MDIKNIKTEEEYIAAREEYFKNHPQKQDPILSCCHRHHRD